MVLTTQSACWHGVPWRILSAAARWVSHQEFLGLSGQPRGRRHLLDGPIHPVGNDPDWVQTQESGRLARTPTVPAGRGRWIYSCEPPPDDKPVSSSTSSVFTIHSDVALCRRMYNRIRRHWQTGLSGSCRWTEAVDERSGQTHFRKTLCQLLWCRTCFLPEAISVTRHFKGWTTTYMSIGLQYYVVAERPRSFRSRLIVH